MSAEIDQHHTDDNYCPLWGDELLSCEECGYCEVSTIEYLLTIGTKENADTKREITKN